MPVQSGTHDIDFHHIDEELDLLSPIPPERCIFRVHDRLRKVDEKAYEPKTIAIGPYHHRKYNPNAKLQAMEEHKLRYLKQLVKRRNEMSVERYVVAMQELEERARNCYAEPISLDKDEFVKMMLLDSCFIVELLRKYTMPELRNGDDPIFQLIHILNGVQFDLMLFENQLPFFVLVKFFDMTKTSNLRDNMIRMALQFFQDVAPSGQLSAPNGIVMDNINHLLGLVHYCYCFPFAEMMSQRNVGDHVSIDNTFIKSATELQEAGIKFVKFERRIMFDIRFVNGRMEIPPLRVEDGTESVLRNLIAYEQYLPDTIPKYITDYSIVMDCLVDSSKDVEKLRLKGIIDNYLGDDEVLSTMFNKLLLEVSSCSDFFCYSKVFYDVNKHYERQCNVWMASLRRNYFNSPWALISFLAAVVLLLLTIAQTVFAVLSFPGFT